MILTFEFAGDFVKVKILGNNVTFASSPNLNRYVPINFLRLTKEGILKEHPDLKDLSFQVMKEEAIKRFKEHITELEVR